MSVGHNPRVEHWPITWDEISVDVLGGYSLSQSVLTQAQTSSQQVAAPHISTDIIQPSPNTTREISVGDNRCVLYSKIRGKKGTTWDNERILRVGFAFEPNTLNKWLAPHGNIQANVQLQIFEAKETPWSDPSEAFQQVIAQFPKCVISQLVWRVVPLHRSPFEILVHCTFDILYYQARDFINGSLDFHVLTQNKTDTPFDTSYRVIASLFNYRAFVDVGVRIVDRPHLVTATVPCPEDRGEVDEEFSIVLLNSDS